MDRPDLPNLDDQELSEHLGGGMAREALAELWKRHEHKLRSACLRTLRDEADAEDVVQETFVRAIRHLEAFEAKDVAGWLWTIARNLCVSKLRSAVSRLERQWPEGMEVAGTPETEGLSDDRPDRLIALLESLPEKQRVSLKLFYLEGFTYEEVAHAAGLSIKEVKSAIQNGRRMLRKKFDGR